VIPFYCSVSDERDPGKISTNPNRLLAVSTAHQTTVDQIALLSFVPKTTGFVRARGLGSTVDDITMTVLPASDAKEKVHGVALLLLPELLDVLEGTHCRCDCNGSAEWVFVVIEGKLRSDSRTQWIHPIPSSLFSAGSRQSLYVIACGSTS
jgi:hypothetical protein